MPPAPMAVLAPHSSIESGGGSAAIRPERRQRTQRLESRPGKRSVDRIRDLGRESTATPKEQERSRRLLAARAEPTPPQGGPARRPSPKDRSPRRCRRADRRGSLPNSPTQS